MADRTDTLFRNKAWEVQGVTFDDGSYACLAEVSDPGESFTIWIFQDASIRLQFYSEDWDFGDYKKTAGVGILWASPLGPLRLAWGYNLDQKAGENQSSWDFSMGGTF